MCVTLFVVLLVLCSYVPTRMLERCVANESMCILHQSASNCPLSFLLLLECFPKHGSWLQSLLSDFLTFALKSPPISIMSLFVSLLFLMDVIVVLIS